MATYLWSSVTNGQNIDFNPFEDVFQFDNPALLATQMLPFGPGTEVTFSGAGKTFTLTVGSVASGVSAVRALTTTNMVFDSGSKLIIGDNSTSTSADNLANSLTGGAQADLLIGDGGNDTMLGGGGDDIIVVGNANQPSGNDSVNGGAGDADVISAGANSTAGATIDFRIGKVSSSLGTANFVNIEWAYGTNLADTFYATQASRVYSGYSFGAAADFARLMEGRGGADKFYGDARPGMYEIVTYRNAPNGVNVNLATGAGNDGYDSNTSMAGVQSYTDKLVAIDAVVGSFFDDTLSAGGTAVAISGVRFESLEGLKGNDTLNANGGTIVRADYLTAPAGVTVDLAAGSAQDGYGTVDTLVGINWVRGSSFADSLTGDGHDNALEGRGGNDTLKGGAGADLASFVSATAGVTITLADTGITTANLSAAGLGVDKLSAIEGLRGGDFADRLTGNGLGNVLIGGAGNDTLDGRAGMDLVRYETSPHAVNVNLATGVAQDGYGNSDALLRLENVRGSSFGDIIKGNAAANVLDGWLGKDTLSGGGGTDKFLFAAAGNANADKISDFLPGTDDILLENGFFTALSVGTLSSGSFRKGAGITTAADASDHIIYDTTSGALYYDADGNGTAKAPVLIATLVGSPDALSAGDILVT
jgi:Ca2+-binding RTX toxin-like protein